MYPSIFIVLLSFIPVCVAQKDAIEDGPFNFDIETKTKIDLPTCVFDFKYDIAKGVVSAACFVVGVFILLFGYKRRRISFCLTGLTSVSIMTYLILLMEQKFSMTINILIALSIGLLISLFATVLLYCGYFITGLFAGFVVGIIFLLIFTSFSSLFTIAVSCVIVAAFGLVQVFITMWWRHRVYIVSSCLLAAALIVCSLDYFVEGLFLLSYIEMKVFYHRTAELCWWTYLIFALFGFFLIIGLVVQCCYTGKEVQKEPYTFVYLTKRRMKRNKPSTRHMSPSQHDEENYLINSNG